MRYTPLSAELYQKNREKFKAKMHPNTLAVFNSNDIFPTSADSTLPFKQHSDLLYLSGVDQEESILVLFPDALQTKHQEILFLKETNEHIAIWEGEKLNKEQATALSGVQTIYWLSDFEKIFYSLMSQCQGIYLNRNEHYRAQLEVETREDRFINKVKKEYPLHQIFRSNPILQELRAVKEAEEIAQLQKACDITQKGFKRVLEFVKPGVMEYEIEAEFMHEFLRNGSRGFAYTPIIASGNNANVLHYIQNNAQCQAGELILMDVGAEYGNYCSDMTRMVPVSGTFSPRQKEIYQAVLSVKNKAAEMLVPGNNWHDYHQEVGKIMTHTLLDLGLLDKADVQNENPDWPAYKKYFMHGTSHHIGLDTHDYGLLHLPFEANMVFTVEPGIYLPEEGFGIRLEDDYVIQPQGSPLNLMQHIPIEIEEIEEIMNKA